MNNFQPNLIYWAFYITLALLVLPGAIITGAGLWKQRHARNEWTETENEIPVDATYTPDEFGSPDLTLNVQETMSAKRKPISKHAA